MATHLQREVTAHTHIVLIQSKDICLYKDGENKHKKQEIQIDFQLTSRWASGITISPHLVVVEQPAVHNACSLMCGK